MFIDPNDRYDNRSLDFYGKAISSHKSTTIQVEFHLLILDTNGEIYITSYDYRDKFGPIYGFPSNQGWGYQADPVGSEEGQSMITLKEQEKGEDETIPDTVQGVFTAIFSAVDVYNWDLWWEENIPDDLSIEYIYG